jgi:hypothetical protein
MKREEKETTCLIHSEKKWRENFPLLDFDNSAADKSKTIYREREIEREAASERGRRPAREETGEGGLNTVDSRLQFLSFFSVCL